jgi:hypothetical protein
MRHFKGLSHIPNLLSIVFKILGLASVWHFTLVSANDTLEPKGENPGVTRLREYLRLKAVHPNPDYGKFYEL